MVCLGFAIFLFVFFFLGGGGGAAEFQARFLWGLKGVGSGFRALGF